MVGYFFGLAVTIREAFHRRFYLREKLESVQFWTAPKHPFAEC